MKNTIAMAAILGMFATASIADDFDNNTYTTTIETGAANLKFTFSGESLASFESGVTALTYDIGSAQSTVETAFLYDFNTDTISVTGSHTTTAYVGDLSVYGITELEYRTVETDLSDGNFYANPSIGVDYGFNNTVSVFGEVGYSWDMTDDWAQQGGYIEIGMPINTPYNIVFTPSVVRGFDDGTDETNLNIDLTMNF